MEYGEPGWWVPFLIFPGMGIIFIPLFVGAFIYYCLEWLWEKWRG